jgi:HSP20 family protein
MATDLIRKMIEPINRDALTLRDAMERFWDVPMGLSPWRWAELGADLEMAVPAVDVSETGAEYTLKAALPGWKPENVTITYEGGMVTIEGEVKEETEDKKDARYHRKEIRQRSFSRSFSLPADVDSAKAAAEFKDGLLMITLPKSEVVKPKRIKINAK